MIIIKSITFYISAYRGTAILALDIALSDEQQLLRMAVYLAVNNSLTGGIGWHVEPTHGLVICLVDIGLVIDGPTGQEGLCGGTAYCLVTAYFTTYSTITPSRCMSLTITQSNLHIDTNHWMFPCPNFA